MVAPSPSFRLTDILWALTLDPLKMIARRCGKPIPTQKAVLITFIDRAMQSREFIVDQLNQATALTRAALAMAAHGDGTLDPNRFFVLFGVPYGLPTHSPYDRPDGHRYDPVASVAELFLYGGRIPSDLISTLRELLPAPTPFALTSFESLAESVEASLAGFTPDYRKDLTEPTPLTTEEGALHDLLATLMVASDNKVLVGETTGLPSIAAVRALRQRFLVSTLLPGEDGGRGDDAIRPAGFAAIARAAGLVRIQLGKLELTKAGRAALLDPSPALLKACWAAWIAWDGPDELTRVRGLKGQKTRGQYFTRTSDRKAAISQALAACPTGRWIPVAEFLRFVRIEHDFAIDASAYTALYVGYSREEGSVDYLDVGTWNATCGAYIRVILLEYAATLGLIDVATIPLDEAELDFGNDYELSAADFSRYFSLAHLRVNNLGRYILGGSDSYSGPASVTEQASLTVLPSLDVVVADRSALPPNDRAMLERFSTRVSEDVYHLSKERLLEAIEGGFDPRDAEAFLHRRGIQNLPQTAAVLFADVTRAATALRGVGPAQIVECADAHLAVLISHDSALKSLCILAGERHLAVPDASLAAFRRGLRRLGYVLPDRSLALKARKSTGRKT
jgi:hypothetical protein